MNRDVARSAIGDYWPPALALLVLMVSFGCALTPPPKPIETPRPSPRPATPAPTTLPTTAPTSVPAARPVPTVASACNSGFSSVYNGFVMGAQRQYRQAHPEQFEGNVFLPPLVQEVYIQGIVDILIENGLDAIVDPCMCGDMAVSDPAFAIGTGFAEQFHPISSDRKIQTGGYLERCTPRWFDRSVGARTPTPPTPMPTVPTETVALLKIPGRQIAKFEQGALTCLDFDFTPRFNLVGCNNPGPGGCPCDKIPTFSCTRQPDQAQMDFKGGPRASAVPDKNFRGRVCGQKGQAYTLWIEPGTEDEAGRPLNLKKFETVKVTGKF